MVDRGQPVVTRPRATFYSSRPGPLHQFLNGAFRSLAAHQDRLHLLGDGHFHTVSASESERGGCRAHALRHSAFEPARMSSSLCPCPSPMPTVRFRESDPVQVSTRSPIPESPARVSRRPPHATARRVISAMPRVISAALLLNPSPSPPRYPRQWQSRFSAIRPAPRR